MKDIPNGSLSLSPSLRNLLNLAFSRHMHFSLKAFHKISLKIPLRYRLLLFSLLYHFFRISFAQFIYKYTHKSYTFSHFLHSGNINAVYNAHHERINSYSVLSNICEISRICLTQQQQQNLYTIHIRTHSGTLSSAYCR